VSLLTPAIIFVSAYASSGYPVVYGSNAPKAYAILRQLHLFAMGVSPRGLASNFSHGITELLLFLEGIF
jgi:hypothetical protein